MGEIGTHKSGRNGTEEMGRKKWEGRSGREEMGGKDTWRQKEERGGDFLNEVLDIWQKWGCDI